MFGIWSPMLILLLPINISSSSQTLLQIKCPVPMTLDLIDFTQWQAWSWLKWYLIWFNGIYPLSPRYPVPRESIAKPHIQVSPNEWEFRLSLQLNYFPGPFWIGDCYKETAGVNWYKLREQINREFQLGFIIRR